MGSMESPLLSNLLHSNQHGPKQPVSLRLESPLQTNVPPLHTFMKGSVDGMGMIYV